MTTNDEIPLALGARDRHDLGDSGQEAVATGLRGRLRIAVPPLSTFAATVPSFPVTGTLDIVPPLGAPSMTECQHEFRLPGEIEAIRTKIQTCRGLEFRCSKSGQAVMSYGRESDLNREIERRRLEGTKVDRSDAES